MTEPTTSNLPAQIASAFMGIPAALVPTSVKALDRLVGASIDIPVAWLHQQKARIEAKTKSLESVEAAVAKGAVAHVGADNEIADRAATVLLRKEYRRQDNKEAVGVAALEDLRMEEAAQASPTDAPPPPPIEDDWLNVFERYAEDASSERMQKLWGRVLAGEIRKPGKFSMRTLRFLSEFSQGDALLFSAFCHNAFRDSAPASLVRPPEMKDMRSLFNLEDAGLIKGTDGLGMNLTLTFNQQGNVFLIENSLVLWLRGEPNISAQFGVMMLTQLGQELVSLLPDRDAKASARVFANAIRTPQIKSAALGRLDSRNGSVMPMEILWQEPEGHVTTKIVPTA